MKDPQRFADGHPSSVARSLLAGAFDEEPPPSLFEQTLTAAGGAGTNISGGSALSSVSSGISAAVAKYVGLGAVAGALATGAAVELWPTSSPSASPPSVVAQPARVVASAEVSVLQAPAEPVVPDQPIAVDELPRLAGSRAAQAQRAEASEPDHPERLLREEAVVIDRARQAVATGNPKAALRALEDHGLRFERPQFHPEALYLRMQALRLRGDERAAREVARRLLYVYPNGAHAALVRAFLKTDGP